MRLLQTTVFLIASTLCLTGCKAFQEALEGFARGMERTEREQRNDLVEGGERETYEVRDGRLVIRQLLVPLDWSPSEQQLKSVLSLLARFNDRLYDATDGQIWIRGFIIVNGPSWNKWARETGNAEVSVKEWLEAPGLHIHEVWKDARGEHRHDADAAGLGHPDGTPSKPKHGHLGYDWMKKEGIDSYAGTALMEFLHSWFGLLDEYEGTEKHPHRAYEPRVGDACKQSRLTCLMDDPRSRTEFCRPGLHSKSNAQERFRKTDCYTWLSQVTEQHIGVKLRIPRRPTRGPNVAPEAQFWLVPEQLRDPDDLQRFANWYRR